MKIEKKIVIVEDHPVFRMGMSELINQEEDLDVCAWADNVTDAWNEISRLKPDLVIVDITLKNSDGLELVRNLKKYHKNIPVLVLSMHQESLFAERSVMAGAKGYIMKQEAPALVVTAIRKVLAGKLYFSNAIMEKLVLSFTSSSAEHAHSSPVDRLTQREFEVFKMLGQGLKTRQIAEQLNLSIKTIGTYRERIKEKLNIKDANELLMYAVTWERV
ncbi:MAG: response regulator transcription factor [Thermodesulfobacteriota bacterium]|nr:response regulator transcription factor [Thermodesulfobacteriota bacterium]